MITIDFGREPIGRFNVKISIAPSFAPYFLGIDISDVKEFSVFPAFLALADTTDNLDIPGVLKSLNTVDNIIGDVLD